MRRPTALLAAAAGGVSARALYRLVVTGRLVADTGIGRRLRPLGPIAVDIDAPRELVFDVIAAPYVRERSGAAGDEDIEVLERGNDMVLAAHRTVVGPRLVATTVETVRFDPPGVVSFRLLRGPVPHVVETFRLHDAGGTTRLVYEGELGTDLGAVGARWGELVARKWEATVRASLETVRSSAEQRAAAHRRRAGSSGG